MYVELMESPQLSEAKSGEARPPRSQTTVTGEIRPKQALVATRKSAVITDSATQS